MKFKVDSKSKLIVFLLSLFVALFAFGVNPALAHNAFDSSSPSEGDLLETSPSGWTITFTKSVPLDSFSGEVINGGFGMLLNGSKDSERRLKSMLHWDVNNGIARRAWARNDEAKFAIARAMEAEPLLKVTMPNEVDPELGI